MRLMEVMLRARLRLLGCVCTALAESSQLQGALLPLPAVGTLRSAHMERASCRNPKAV